MRIVVLAGGTGAARFVRGLRAAEPTADITVVGNTADDITLFGLRVCPDLDTVMYTLGGGISESQGWGRDDETFVVRDELAAYGGQPTWFGLGDRDLATHVMRSWMLAAGYPLSAVTAALCARWQPGVTLLPMTDAQVETHVRVTDGEGTRWIHFQEWWVRLHASLPAEGFVQLGIDDAKPGPGVLEAVAAADVVLLAPSNPVVSVGPVLAVPGLREAVAERPVVGLSPIIGGAPLRGMADACLRAIGVETSAAGVAEHYGAPLLDGWLVDVGDAAALPRVEAAGVLGRAVPLVMSSVEATAAMAREALSLAATLAR